MNLVLNFSELHTSGSKERYWDLVSVNSMTGSWPKRKRANRKLVITIIG